MDEEGKEREWQPIETAPKDGTPIFGYVPWKHSKAKMTTICFEKGQWIIGRDNRGGIKPAPVPPTHWMPLPQHPRSKEER